MSTYTVKEIFYTLQGEGAHAGRAAVFVRFAGCNLWTGREQDRHKAICQFCDTDFIGTDGELGGKYTATEIADHIVNLWPSENTTAPFVVCTGGEPLLQLDDELVEAMHNQRIEIAVETNGTQDVPDGIDWICMSPKANTKIVVRSGQEIKIVFPQSEITPSDFSELEFEHFFIQPMDGPQIDENTISAIAFCKKHPQWKLSIQTHKLLNIP